MTTSGLIFTLVRTSGSMKELSSIIRASGSHSSNSLARPMLKPTLFLRDLAWSRENSIPSKLILQPKIAECPYSNLRLKDKIRRRTLTVILSLLFLRTARERSSACSTGNFLMRELTNQRTTTRTRFISKSMLTSLTRSFSSKAIAFTLFLELYRDTNTIRVNSCSLALIDGFLTSWLSNIDI